MRATQAIKYPIRLWAAAVCLLCFASGQAAEPTVRDTFDGIISRMLGSLSQEQLLQLDKSAAQRFIAPEDRGVLATQYWHFEANVPVVVSVMRDVKQAELPFWLPAAGFRKTELKVANEEYEYEVWQKRFAAGRVGLGINGFTKHRPHYFVCVAPEPAGAKLKLSHFFPANQQVMEMRQSAFIYEDWPDLVLTNVPDALKGQKLLPTFRGRAREAQLVQAFRMTPFPSSRKPDQLVLTWSESPRTTQTIQWRTSPAVDGGTVRYRKKDAAAGAPWNKQKAERQTLADRLLVNDPRVNHFTATLRGLKPATTYVYTVGDATADSRSEPSEFTTAPGGDEPFTFVFLSDTHKSPACGKLLARALESHPETAFCTISGDLVSTGQYRDDWDQFFEHAQDFSRRRPLVPAIGNHDTLDGLGADLYLSLFGLPNNGVRRLQPERSYSFEYANALFIILDCTASVEDQRPWLEARLARTRATWKFAIFHFPPYGPEVDYPDIIREWCSVFDKYHVDFVLSGHVHDYVRTHPINHGSRVASPTKGTVYLVTVSVPTRPGPMSKPDYVAVAEHPGLPLYQVFTINGKRLITRSCDLEGKTRDELVIEK
jgi:Purple acid Phosphatase, N-terminal domain/Calcineurin-like phosphoesterase